MSDVRHVITLIHGTWATKARWIRSNSMLSKALQERLGQDVKIFRLLWSGRNSPSARSAAAKRLKSKLALRLKQYPSARHYIISHSHGGNIALYAIAGTDLESKIDGIVCLATPFLLARERDLGIDAAHVLGPGIFVGALLSLLGIGVLWPGIWANSTVVWLVMMAMLIFAFFLAFHWIRFAHRLKKELTPPLISDPSRFLIIRSPADEASGALIFSQFQSWLAVRIYLYLENVFDKCKAAVTLFAARKWIVAAVIVAALVVFTISLIAISGPVDLATWPGTATKIALVVSILFTGEALILFVPKVGVDWATVMPRLVISLIFWPMILLLSVFLLPFGWRIALANVLMDVTAETTPVGSSWSVHLVLLPGRQPAKDIASQMQNIPLMHSIIYENPSVLKIVSDWIAKEQSSTSAVAT